MSAIATIVQNPSSAAAVSPLRVMVVDDSLVLRGLISRMINEVPAVAQVVASAGNGLAAVERAAQRDLDVVVLDIEMPVMDGITALPKLLAIDPNLVVIMASTLTTRNADISLKAISSGAKDYVPKPSSVTQGAGAEEFKRDLLEKIKVLGERYRRSARPMPTVPAPRATSASAKPAFSLRALNPGKPALLAIGCSTGGPNALQSLLKVLRPPLRVPVIITQHMPPTFTALLAENIERETGHKCAEAKDNEQLVPGRILIAPGDFHIVVARAGATAIVRLNQDPKENFCRPAVDPMLRTAAAAFPGQVLAVILTGMGQDGLAGGETVVKAGGNLLAQDEASSVVWGMPGAVARRGLAAAVLPVPELAARIRDLLGR